MYSSLVAFLLFVSISFCTKIMDNSDVRDIQVSTDFYRLYTEKLNLNKNQPDILKIVKPYIAELSKSKYDSKSSLPKNWKHKNNTLESNNEPSLRLNIFHDQKKHFNQNPNHLKKIRKSPLLHKIQSLHEQHEPGQFKRHVKYASPQQHQQNSRDLQHRLNIPRLQRQQQQQNRRGRQEHLRQHQQLHHRIKRQSTNFSGIDDIIGMLGPKKQTDFVIAIARSIGVGMRNFYTNERPLAKSILREFATLHPDYVRVSLITFAMNATLVYDSIGANFTSDQCSFFGGGAVGEVAPFDRMVFVDDALERSGCNLKAVMRLARLTFDAGRIKRPAAKQLMLVMTDGNVPSQGDQDPIGEDWNTMRNNNVSIFAVGIGVWLTPLAVRAIVTTGPSKFYYGDLSDWNNMVQNGKKIQNLDYSAVYSGLSASYCSGSLGPGLCSSDKSCYCNVHSGTPECTCGPGLALSPIRQQCELISVGMYKAEPGPSGWSNCPYPLTTSNEASTKFSDCICSGNKTCNSYDACLTNPCGTHRPCSTLSNGMFECGPCYAGWLGPDCNLATATCDNYRCQNGAQCCVRGTQPQCLCGFGYYGAHCEWSDDYCVFAICTNNSTCSSGSNNFQCTCRSGWIGDFCQDEDTRTSPLSPSASTPYYLVIEELVSKEKLNLAIIIACSVVGGVLLLLLILLIVCCVIYRRRKKRNDSQVKSTFESGTSTEGLYNSVHAKQVHKVNSNVYNKMSVRFSGFWKKGTWRASDCDGLPSVPSKYPDGKGDGMQNVDLDETVLEQEIINDTNRMNGWTQYLKELYTAGSIERAVLARLDNKDEASTKTWHLDWDEIYRLDLLLTNGSASGVENVEIQQVEFRLDVDRKTRFATGKKKKVPTATLR